MIPVFVVSADAPPTTDPAVQRLEDEIKTLETRQQIVIDSMEKTYNHGFWFITVAVAVTTILSGIRYMQDQRLLKDAQELGKSYKQNIDTTNSLMTSVKSAVDYYKDAQDTIRQVNELKDAQEVVSRNWEEQMAKLNDDAMSLSPDCKRNAHNNSAVQRAVRDFHDRYEILQRSSNTTEKLNANGHFILGFHFRIENRYDEALDQFTTAQQLAAETKFQASHPAYRKLPSSTPLEKWLTKLENICAFHRAILHNNLGEYETAKRHFEAALGADPFDYQSLAYIPETMFLGGLSTFSRVIEAYKGAVSKVETLTAEQERSFTFSKKSLLSLLYLKLGNCYMAQSTHLDYREHRDLAEAEKHIRTALSYDSQSLFARLSLAQLFQCSGREPQRARELFAEVFTSAQTVVARVSGGKQPIEHLRVLQVNEGAHSATTPGDPAFEFVKSLSLIREMAGAFEISDKTPAGKKAAE